MEEKPFAKYQRKFFDLLKEAEAEFGDYLTIKVSSRPISTQEEQGRAYCERTTKQYDFELHTNSFVY